MMKALFVFGWLMLLFLMICLAASNSYAHPHHDDQIALEAICHTDDC